MSHGRFDQPPETMKISTNGDLVEACGPLLWNDEGNDNPAGKVTIKHVDIRQESSGAHATSDPQKVFVRPAAPDPEDDWMVDPFPSQGPKRFVDGLAEAFAVAEVVLQDGEQVRQERWPRNGSVTVALSH